MGQLPELIIYSFFAGITIFLGGILACLADKHMANKIEKHVIHWSMAFGGGILMAAIAFVLAPRGMQSFSPIMVALIFLSGSIVFFVIDKIISQSGGTLAQTMAMLMDFIPESLALGAMFAHNHRLGILLALFIGFQNLPESFNAYFDLRKSGQTAKSVLITFFALSFAGIVMVLVGRHYLVAFPSLTAGIMLFAAGGILYLIFQDIAPSSRMKNHWEPALGANLGFLVGMLGTMIFS